MGLRGAYKRLQEVNRVRGGYRELQEVKQGYKGIQAVTGG